MKRRLVIDGNSVYELDEACMLRKKAKQNSDSRIEDNREDIANDTIRDWNEKPERGNREI